MHTRTLSIRAARRGLHEITGQIGPVVSGSGVQHGLCNLFIRHTSASLVVSENWDPSARADLEAFLDRLVPEEAPYFTHTLEGADDMPSHIKSALTQVSLTLPVVEGKLALGTWQGVYLWEHRHAPPLREIVVTVFGSA